MKTAQHQIIFAGYGGQGIVLVGNLLARACIFENKHVTGMVAYGAEMRGGTANATVIISDEEIASPVVEHANIGYMLNEPSLDRFEDTLTDGAMVILNSSLVKRDLNRRDLRAVKIAATEIAEGLGEMRTANIVALGTLVKAAELLKPQSVLEAIDELFSEKNKAMAQVNKIAFSKGYELAGK